MVPPYRFEIRYVKIVNSIVFACVPLPEHVVFKEFDSVFAVTVL